MPDTAVAPATPTSSPTDRARLLDAYRTTRRLSLELTEPLPPGAWRVQPITDVSPPWWNLGHTTWFFARNILKPWGRYTEADEQLEYPLNSYYESLGPRVPRDQRGLLTRPTTEEILAFRRSVDERMERLLAEAPAQDWEEIASRVAIGIHHEQQHQELLVTEIHYIYANDPPPLRQAYHTPPQRTAGTSQPLTFVPFEGGVCEFGNLEGGWCFDNEMPVHKGYLEDFALGHRLVTNAEWLEFMADGGYDDPLLWLSNGWTAAREQGWRAPLYWEYQGESWQVWTLGGPRPVEPAEPVAHVSFYEADAYARWRSEQGGEAGGCRLPTEREWEQAARASGFDPALGHFLESRELHPRPARQDAFPGGLTQMAGELWEWTSSHYEPYPRYQPFEGELSEYNGKFMDNQRVLRGGSCVTPASHIRLSYRNFWPGSTRFQKTGLRLAKSLE